MEIGFKYRDEVVKAMKMLAEDPRVIFIGQSVCWPGHAMYNTLQDAKVPMEQRLEVPVFEETQMGMSIGLALEGRIPVSIFPRMDFLVSAMNQLVNHLDKIEEMSCGRFKPKVIIRTMVGSKIPLDGGPQHTQDHTEALRLLLTNVDIYKLVSPEQVMLSYTQALDSHKSSVIVEIGDLY